MTDLPQTSRLLDDGSDVELPLEGGADAQLGDQRVEAIVARLYPGDSIDTRLQPGDDDAGTPDLICDGLGCGGHSARRLIRDVLTADAQLDDGSDLGTTHLDVGTVIGTVGTGQVELLPYGASPVRRPARSPEPPRASSALASASSEENRRQIAAAFTKAMHAAASDSSHRHVIDRVEPFTSELHEAQRQPAPDPNVGTCLACGGPVERYTGLGPNPTTWWAHVSTNVVTAHHRAIVDDPTDARLAEAIRQRDGLDNDLSIEQARHRKTATDLYKLRRAIRAESKALRGVIDLHNAHRATRDARLAGIAEALDAMAGAGVDE